MSTKRKAATAIAKPVVRQNAKAPVRTRIDESRTAVSTGLSSKPLSKQSTEAIETPSDDAASQYGSSDDENAASDDERSKTTNQKPPRQKHSQDAADVDVVMQEGGDNSDGEPTAPTFGDLARGNTTTIDVPASLAAQTSQQQQQQPQQQRRQPAAAPISATSLGTVLNQALRTDDADLLESCLQTTDVKIIENTINRMDSALAGTLLAKLSARMHRRPGRAFGLMRWMQWTLVAHGGALAGQPDLVARLGELSRVLEERSRGLGSLLALKGKLDMLDAQMKFRKSVKAGGGAARGRGRGDEDGLSDEEGLGEDAEDVDEPGVVYVEGQEALGGKALLTNGTGGKGTAADEEDDFPAGGDALSDSEEESDEEFEEVEEDLAGVESLNEDEVDHDDVEEDEEDEEEESEGEEARPPAKVRRTSQRISKRS
jgi:U3 small nucleolar RNA-associated protein 5